MKVKLLVGLSGNEYSLAPGDEYDFADGEAARLVEAGYAVKVEGEEPASPTPSTKRKGKTNVVSSEGDGTNE
ncbi:hypothetical protein KHC17_16895 [Agrobacterium salinitolerans]|uniref:hypothetical protein n=1 Tax=Agrobacterium TaxID=357 RepID=UPI000DD76157|nr:MULTISPECIES: hypothetical protein [Agrobacterium]MDP9854509.1 hypothetical protein [Agrobacterium tumefaciens]QXC49539.1 hypothetical protein KHC17_16895 [Agrobacterium salinitolerans]